MRLWTWWMPYSLYLMVKTTRSGLILSRRDGRESACNAGDLGSIPGLGRSPGEGNGNPFQYPCLENPWTEKPGVLQSMGFQRVGHNRVTHTFTFLFRRDSSTPILSNFRAVPTFQVFYHKLILRNFVFLLFLILSSWPATFMVSYLLHLLSRIC